MRTDFNPVRPRQLHSPAHVVEVGSMESAGDIRDMNGGHDPPVVAQAPNAEALAHIAIQQRHQPLRRGAAANVAKKVSIVKLEIVVQSIFKIDTGARCILRRRVRLTYGQTLVDLLAE